MASNNSIRFLTRFDKSATNIKESHVWAAIGQTPWSYPYSFWYHVVPMFPFQALEAAAKLGEYSLVDWGTWNGVQDFVRKEMIVYVSIACRLVVSKNLSKLVDFVKSEDRVLGTKSMLIEIRDNSSWAKTTRLRC